MDAGPKEIPELVSELATMSREYLRQEIVEPAKKLGRFAGFGMGAAALFSLRGGPPHTRPLFIAAAAFAGHALVVGGRPSVHLRRGRRRRRPDRMEDDP